MEVQEVGLGLAAERPNEDHDTGGEAIHVGAAPGRSGTGGVRRHTWLLATIATGAFLHRGWFSTGVLAAGDWVPLVKGRMLELLQLPQSWLDTRGLGGPNAGLSGAPYEIVIGLLARLGISYGVIERALFFLPAAVVPFVAMYVLAGRLTRVGVARYAAALLYGANTYILLVSTNQLTIAMAYALAPLALASAHKAAEERDTTSAFRAAMWCGLSTVYDPRMGLLTGLATLLCLVVVGTRRSGWRRMVLSAGVVAAVVGGLQLYWVLPLVVAGRGQAFEGLLPTDPFHSFATLGHGLFLHHPFWTGGLPLVFVTVPPDVRLAVLPLLGLAGLAVAWRHARRSAVLFALLVVGGAFLVKGENGPFPEFYGWAFDHVPGLQLFRDMTKFYVFVALGYAGLVALLLHHVVVAAEGLGAAEAGRPRQAADALRLPALLVVIALVAYPAALMAKPAASESLGGATRSTSRGPEARLEPALAADGRFGRVLWLPHVPAFALQTEVHPAVLLEDVAAVTPGGRLLDVLERRDLPRLLANWRIRYVALAGQDVWSGRDRPSGADRTRLQQVFARAGLRRVVGGNAELWMVDEPINEVEVAAPVAYEAPAPAGGSVLPQFIAPGQPAVPRVALARAQRTLGIAQTDGAITGAIVKPGFESAKVADGVITVQLRLPLAGSYEWDSLAGIPDVHGVVVVVRDASGNPVWFGVPSKAQPLHVAASGEYSMELRSSEFRESLLINPSFEDGAWAELGNAQDADGATLQEAGISAGTADRGDGSRYLVLRANRDLAGIGREVEHFSHAATYLLSFEWRRNRGAVPQLGLYFGPKVRSYREFLNGGAGWHRRAVRVDPPAAASTVGVGFYTGPGAGFTESVASFDDVRLTAVPPWVIDIGLRWVAPANATPGVPGGVVRFDESGATKRKIRLQPPDTTSFVVTDASRFSTDWRATFWVGSGSSRRTLRSVHVEAIGGMNGWVVEHPSAGLPIEGRITYGPQRAAELGAVASLLVAVLALVLSFRRRRHREAGR